MQGRLLLLGSCYILLFGYSNDTMARLNNDTKNSSTARRHDVRARFLSQLCGCQRLFINHPCLYNNPTSI
ncbi:hypothetical protein CAEBREN_16525 [Caenorhabditis brenneri]|uniref:Secreted protein n=1 Tax=Caenorhabditis brenneri TaxID=135651 RepID=G0MAG5_CAEBE|nr:hypothetical protein CAEBREN_16525 [Caenorhabditis brenneri]